MVKTTIITIGGLALLSLAFAPGWELRSSSQRRLASVTILPLESSSPLQTSPFIPLALPPDLELEKAELGRTLFLDTRLSKDQTVSCRTCHDLDHGGADSRRFSVGVGSAVGKANAPTVFNTALNFRQFWNGRAPTLEDQMQEPIHNPVEMAADWPTILSRLRGDPRLSERFRRVFGRDVDEAGVVDAIAEFEKALVTVDSPLDLYLKGDKNALGERALRGYAKFEQYGCVSCHQGMNVGGNMYQTMGVVHDYFAERGGRYDSDEGRFAVTHDPQDLHVFKVPSLRNVALTAPYFHDGSEPSLDNAIRKMARYQLGRVLPEDDVADIAEFLRSLTGKQPAILEAGPR